MAVGDFIVDASRPTFGDWAFGWLDTGLAIPFSRQATMRFGAAAPVVPPAATLSFDFTASETVDPRITVSGGTNGYRTNSLGKMVSGPAPRFDYDPITLQPRGLLIEPAGTNLQPRAIAFTDAIWTPTDTTVAGFSGTSPDNLNNATLMTEGSAGTAQLINSQIGQTAGQTYTISRFFKYNGCRWVSMQYSNPTFISAVTVWFDIQNGVVGGSTNIGATITNLSARIIPAGGGWYRCCLTANLGSYANAVTVTKSASADLSNTRVNGASYYMWGAMMELGSFPTTFIMTVSASGNRTADSFIMTGANFSSWFNALAGTVMIDHDLPGFYSSNPLFAIDDNSANNRITANRVFTGNVNLQVTTGGASQCNLQSANAQLNPATPTKGAMAWAANDFAVCLNGGAVALDAAGTIPVVSQCRIGALAVATPLGGHVRKFAYYNSRLTNAQLQAITA